MRRIWLAAAVTTILVVPTTVLAAHRFADVADSNIFHEDIAWLVDADVTRGCNPPSNDEFCPSDQVTRQQMAAFMRRLAENRVVDAGRLEGLTVDQLVAEVGNGPVSRPVLSYVWVDGRAAFPDGQFSVFTVASVTVEASTQEGGAALAEAVGTMVGDTAEVDENRDLACWIATAADDTASNRGALVQYRPGQRATSATFATSHAVEVAAGESVTFYLRCRDISGGAGNDFAVSGARLSGIFLPGETHTVDAEPAP